MRRRRGFAPRSVGGVAWRSLGLPYPSPWSRSHPVISRLVGRNRGRRPSVVTSDATRTRDTPPPVRARGEEVCSAPRPRRRPRQVTYGCCGRGGHLEPEPRRAVCSTARRAVEVSSPFLATCRSRSLAPPSRPRCSRSHCPPPHAPSSSPSSPPAAFVAFAFSAAVGLHRCALLCDLLRLEAELRDGELDSPNFARAVFTNEGRLGTARRRRREGRTR